MSGGHGFGDLPAPVPLLAGYDRHRADDSLVREQLAELAARRVWADLGWAELIEELLALGRTDVPLSRLAEGHVDALRILRQAGAEPADGALYGVWASRSQRTGVAARRTGEDLVLEGSLRFASGAGVLDRALVPVWLEDGEHLLIDLPVHQLAVDRSGWQTRAMEVSRSFTVAVGGLRIRPEAVVGGPGFYLGRPAFFPGGVGVAACWTGAAARVLDLSRARLWAPYAADLTRRIGVMATRLHTATAVVRAAAAELDRLRPEQRPVAAGEGTGDDPGTRPVDWLALSSLARAAAADAGHDLLDQAVRAAGPAGLAHDLDLTRAVDDLRLYLLQQNADADAALLGSRALGESGG